MHAFLGHHRRIGLDTSIFIYHLESNPRYAVMAGEIFAWIGQPGNTAIASTITVTELLVPVYRNAGEDRVQEIYGLLATYPNLTWIAPDLDTADLAARMRALYGLRTPDALHAATAVRAGAGGFVTNDPIFSRIELFRTFILEG